MTVSIWYLCAGMAVAYVLGIWIGWVAHRHHHAEFLRKVRRAVEWGG